MHWKDGVAELKGLIYLCNSSIPLFLLDLPLSLAASISWNRRWTSSLFCWTYVFLWIPFLLSWWTYAFFWLPFLVDLIKLSLLLAANVFRVDGPTPSFGCLFLLRWWTYVSFWLPIIVELKDLRLFLVASFVASMDLRLLLAAFSRIYWT